MSPKTGHEKPRQPQGDHLQMKTNAARQYKKQCQTPPHQRTQKATTTPRRASKAKLNRNQKLTPNFQNMASKWLENDTSKRPRQRRGEHHFSKRF